MCIQMTPFFHHINAIPRVLMSVSQLVLFPMRLLMAQLPRMELWVLSIDFDEGVDVFEKKLEYCGLRVV